MLKMVKSMNDVIIDDEVADDVPDVVIDAKNIFGDDIVEMK